MPKVIIDAAHGGNDLGLVSDNRFEKNDNIKLATAVGNILNKYGVEVIYTREDDQYVSGLDRIKRANQENPDLFVSLARSSSPIPESFSFVRSSIFSEGGVPEEASKNILNNLEKIGFHSIGMRIMKEPLVLKEIKAPSLILEVGVLNSSYDNQLFDTRLQDVANAIALGILETLGIQTMHIIHTQMYDDEKAPVKYRYCIQTGVFRSYDDALRLQKYFLNQGYQARIEKQGKLIAVQVGNYLRQEDAVRMEKNMRYLGFKTLIVAEADN